MPLDQKVLCKPRPASGQQAIRRCEEPDERPLGVFQAATRPPVVLPSRRMSSAVRGGRERVATGSACVVAQWDRRWFLKCQGLPYRRSLARLARWVSRTGDGPPYAVLGLLCLWNSSPALQAFGWQLLAAFAIEVPLYVLLKHACRRQRPAVVLPGVEAYVQPADRFSLPSGHTAAAFLVATLVMLHAGWPGALLLPWAMAVGASRVILGVHYPGDTVAGATVGSLVALTVFTW
ncbi:MAG: phosphatase PAP2 family protein [Pigmentiphaga sp.]|nr:phosphatase PAP2 family protein [Pigmentiphaga sp.]